VIIKEIENKALIVCGQVLTGRLEVFEQFFRRKVKSFCVIGFSNIFANYNDARCTIYEADKKIYERKLFNLLSPRIKFVKALIFVLAYLVYLWDAVVCSLRFKTAEKERFFLGIGFFPTLLGIILRKLRIVHKVIYYSCDYFPPVTGSIDLILFAKVDKWCIRKSDIIWLVSPRIAEAREKFTGMPRNAYEADLAPLTFDASFLTRKEPELVDRWSLVFVGTSNYLHGLHLLIEAMPKLASRFPQIKVKIIGAGNWSETKAEVARLGFSRYFDFLGFIKEERELFDTVSKCALGLALYVPSEDNPTLYADPGKPKLYAFCAVPVVLSKAPSVAGEIDAMQAGKSIEFNCDSLVEAVSEIIADDSRWKNYRENAFKFAKIYTTQEIFEPLLNKALSD
jgi:glycosyltransferase involved in cell wall biosynthesis